MKRRIMKSILCSLLVIALLSAPVSALAAKKVAYILKVSVSGAPGTYMRSGSTKAGGKESDIIGSLRNGQKVVYWGQKSGQMLKVMTSSGETGYVYQDNLKSYGAISSKQVYVTKGSTTVYKRSGAKKGTIAKNKPVFVYATRGEWAMIKTIGGATGYVKTSAIQKAF